MSPMKSKTAATMETVRSEKEEEVVEKRGENLKDMEKDKEDEEDEEGEEDVKKEEQVGQFTRLDVMVKDVAQLHIEYEDVKSSVESTVESRLQLLRDMKTADASISRLEQEMAELKTDYSNLHNKYGETHEHYLRISSQSRRNNLLLDGVYEDKKETSEQCLEKVYEVLEKHLQVQNSRYLQIDECSRVDVDENEVDPNVGSKWMPKNPQISRPIRFHLHWYSDRQAIWTTKWKLQNTGLWLREDYPTEVIHRRNMLLPIVKEARKLHLDARLRADNLILDSKRYNIHTLGQIPKDLRKSSTKLDEIISTTINSDITTDSDDVSTQNGDVSHQRSPSESRMSPTRNEKVIAFYGASCPFSNFYPAKFKDEYGYVFSSSEQYFQYSKAVFAGDDIAAHKIRKANSPSQCKYIGDRLRTSQGQLDKAVKEMMYKGNLLKFSQNKRLKECLLDTEDCILAEASNYDKVWGIGLGMGDPAVINKAKWKGQNLMGEVLMKVRSVLRGK